MRPSFCHRAIGQIVSAADHLAAGDRDERDGFRVARLEAHRRARGNIEPLAVGFATIELQRGVGFDEVVMAADLDRTIAEYW